MAIQVKSYKRRTKSGKVITVKAYSRKGDKAKVGSGEELKRKKDSFIDAFDIYGNKVKGNLLGEAVSFKDEDGENCILGFIEYTPAHLKRGVKAKKVSPVIQYDGKWSNDPIASGAISGEYGAKYKRLYGKAMKMAGVSYDSNKDTFSKK